ncbi:MAG: Integral rane sensor signal transduction histidine kinase [Parcubacteria group bacterium]|nr:Integral rane sensor signal transduction histidine kinase [Parcubacteria group bacterium]
MIIYKKIGRIRNTFILLFIVLSCAPVIILGVVSLSAIAITHRQNVYNLERQVLEDRSKVIENFFKNILDTLSIQIETLDEKTLNKSGNLWQESFVQSLIEANPAIQEVSFADLQGKETSKRSRQTKTPDMLYVSELPQFKEALLGKQYVGSVHTTLSGQTVSVAVPVFIREKVFNVVLAEVSLLPIAKSLNEVALGDSGYALLFDKEGTFIGPGRKSPFIIGSNLSGWNKLDNFLKGETSSASDFGDRYHSLIGNVPVVGSAMSVSKIGWPLFVEWPISEADAVINTVRNKVLIAIFLSIFLVLGLAPIIASRLVRPIRLLERTSKEIEKGNFDQKISIDTNDEFEELGEAFNHMAVGLKRLQELKNEFVFIAAHELRTPVTAIKWYISSIFEGDAGVITDKMKTFLNVIKVSNERLVNLINDLLYIARSEAGRIEIAVSRNNVKPFIKSIIEEIKPLAIEKNISVFYDPPADLPDCMIDEGQFKEIIMNLLSNAVKYGKNGGWVKISHDIIEKKVSVRIEDNGLGISENDQKRLFEKFYRSDNVKKSGIQGTGLGLFITKELVEKMGGTIDVESIIGKGTTFTVKFNKRKNLRSG